MTCVECEGEGSSLYFGLCGSCQEDYDVFSEYTERRNPPPSPTTILPGKDKIDLLRARWREGFTLFHDDDAQLPPSERKEIGIDFDVYISTNKHGESKYTAKVFREGKPKVSGIFPSSREARLAAQDNRLREDRQRQIDDGELRAKGWGLMKFHKRFWKAFTEASRRRDEALSKMLTKS